MRHRTRRPATRAVAARVESSALTEPVIATLLAMFVAWVIFAI